MLDQKNQPQIPMEDLFSSHAEDADGRNENAADRDSPFAVDRPYQPQRKGQGAFTLLV